MNDGVCVRAIHEYKAYFKYRNRQLGFDSFPRVMAYLGIINLLRSVPSSCNSRFTSKTELEMNTSMKKFTKNSGLIWFKL